MTPAKMHCVMNEKTFSWMVFLTRFIVAAVILYVTIGCLLFYRDFLYNIAVMGVPLPVGIGFGLLIAQIFYRFCWCWVFLAALRQGPAWFVYLPPGLCFLALI